MNLDLILSTVFEKFVKYFPTVVHNMRNCEHNESHDNLSPYHMEGSVWTHTCCVFTQIKHVVARHSLLDEEDVKLLAIAVLFHDIGKPASRVVTDDGRVMFKGHDFVSMYLMMEYKCDITSVFDITNDQFFNIALMIQCHTLYYQLNNINDIYGWLNYDHNVMILYKHLTACDAYGQIRTPKQVSLNRPKLDLFCIDFEDKREPQFDINKNLVVLVGCPASGKDYIATQLFQTDIKNDNAVIVSFDDIRVEEYTNTVDKSEWEYLSYAELYNVAWGWCNDNNINLFNILTKKINEYFFVDGVETVIISNTNVNKKARKALVNLAKRQLKVNVECVSVIAPTHTLLSRNNSRENDSKGKKVPNHAIIRMFESFVLPTVGEGFDTVEYIYNG